MKWLEYSMEMNDDAVDAAAELLQEFCRGGAVIDDPKLVNRYRAEGRWDYSDLQDAPPDARVVVRGYLPVDENLEEVRLKLDDAVCERLSVNFENVVVLAPHELDEIDWATAWKQFFHVLKIGNGMVVKPTWEEYVQAAGEHVIEIDPGMAFGTGTHATTKMCIELLEKHAVAGKRVVDIGTGSGILAIAAALMGAAEIQAVDIDAVAVRVATENVAHNNLHDKIKVSEGDLLTGVSGKCDILLANIIADVINIMLPDIPGKIIPGGMAILSGIICDREGDVLERIEKCGLCCTDRLEENGWCALVVENKQCAE